jgi:hypothetical protein
VNPIPSSFNPLSPFIGSDEPGLDDEEEFQLMEIEDPAMPDRSMRTPQDDHNEEWSTKNDATPHFQVKDASDTHLRTRSLSPNRKTSRKRKVEDLYENEDDPLDAMKTQLDENTKNLYEQWKISCYEMGWTINKMAILAAKGCCRPHFNSIFYLKSQYLHEQAKRTLEIKENLQKSLCGKYHKTLTFLDPELLNIVITPLSMKDCIHLAQSCKYLNFVLQPLLLEKIKKITVSFLNSHKYFKIQSFDDAAKFNSFDLSFRDLVRFPLELVPLKNTITALNLQGNKISSLPETVTQFSRLKTLDLRGNKFTEFPMILLNMTNLQIVHITNNLIKEVKSAVDPKKIHLDSTVAYPISK